MNYGQDAARDNYNKLVKVGSDGILSDNCLSKSYSSASQTFGSQKTVYAGPKEAKEVIGVGNFDECKNLVANLFNKDAKCEV